MGSKKIRPVTPGMRGQVSTDFKDITKKKPEKSLLQSKKSSGGRNNKGRITSRHRGGGHKQKYRVIDFKRIKVVLLVMLHIQDMYLKVKKWLEEWEMKSQQFNQSPLLV